MPVRPSPIDPYGWTIEEIEAQNGEPEQPERGLQAAPPPFAPQAPVSYTEVSDDQSPNYRHLQAGPVAAPFVLSPQALANLCRLNDFTAVEHAGEHVLFGLRGCALVGADDGEFHQEIAVREVAIDHQTTQCVLGVWRRGPEPAVAAFVGSTVPNLAMVVKSVQGLANANMLPTGLHRFVVGVHRFVRGAFRESGPRVVVRARGECHYDVHDAFVAGSPCDNIHPSFHPGDRGFSSAGCQTIRGTASRGEPQKSFDHQDGPGWRTFRERAGLGEPARSADDGRRFLYVLLTGRDLALAGGGDEKYRRLRMGSEGDRVKDLQRSLGVSVDGSFGKTTALAWIARQQATHGLADGIFGPGQE